MQENGGDLPSDFDLNHPGSVTELRRKVRVEAGTRTLCVSAVERYRGRACRLLSRPPKRISQL